MKVLFRSAPWTIPVIFFPILAAAPLPADEYDQWIKKDVEITTKDRGKFIGTIVENREDKIICRLKGAVTIEIRKAEIVGKREWKPLEDFQARKKKASSVEDLVELAKWCRSPQAGLAKEAAECLQEAEERLRNAPPKDQRSLIRAHLALGHVLYRDPEAGKEVWVSEEEYAKKTDQVKVGIKWVPRADADRERFRLRIKGRGDIEKEYEGIDWSLARPRYTDHYILTCNSTDKVIRRFSTLLDLLYDRFDKEIWNGPKLDDSKGEVFLFRNRDEYLDFTLADRRVGGYFDPADGAIRLPHGIFGVDGNTEMVLAHEATHQFQQRIFPYMRPVRLVPFWVVEGMAVYFGEGVRMDTKGNLVPLVPRNRLRTLQMRLRTKTFCGLQELFLLDLARENTGGREYDQGWGIIFWLLDGDDQKGSFGPRGAGRKVWRAYLEHLVKLAPTVPERADALTFFVDHFRKEFVSFKRLLEGGMGMKLPEWEERYREAMEELPVESLGTWGKTGNRWDGSAKIGMKLTFPTGWERIPEGDLRTHCEEAAATVSPEGARLFLSAFESRDKDPRDALRDFSREYLQDEEYDEEVREPQETFEWKGVGIPIVAFRGKFNQEHEKRFGGRFTDEQCFRIALFWSPERIYVVCLVAPKPAFLKKEIRDGFEKTLRTVELNM